VSVTGNCHSSFESPALPSFTRGTGRKTASPFHLPRPLPPPGLRHTVTFDNGKEFARHERIAHATGIDVYFARPYHAWERGANESFNGLVRQFFPKGTDFRRTSPREVKDVLDLLNDRPRKRLGYRTPREVLGQYYPVAFQM
jgi:IS30 family transposase